MCCFVSVDEFVVLDYDMFEDWRGLFYIVILGCDGYMWMCWVEGGLVVGIDGGLEMGIVDVVIVGI